MCAVPTCKDRPSYTAGTWWSDANAQAGYAMTTTIEGVLYLAHWANPKVPHACFVTQAEAVLLIVAYAGCWLLRQLLSITVTFWFPIYVADS